MRRASGMRCWACRCFARQVCCLQHRRLNTLYVTETVRTRTRRLLVCEVHGCAIRVSPKYFRPDLTDPVAGQSAVL